LLEILEALDVLARIEIELEERILARRRLDPERRAVLGVEVLFNGLAHMGVELFLGLLRCDAHWGRSSPKRVFQLSCACFFIRSAANAEAMLVLMRSARTDLSSCDFTTRMSSKSFSRILVSLLKKTS